MCAIKMKFANKCSILELPCVFIDDYFSDCLPVYPLIYIWSYRRLLDGEAASLQEIGERFQLTEGDVIKAWRHWEAKNLVQISGSENEMEITFLPIVSKAEQISAPLTLVAEPREKPAAVRGEAPKYTPPELECYGNESPEIRRIFKSAEKALGMINHSVMHAVFSFYDWLRLPVDVIEFLLEYCAENDRRNIRYIEKCAIDWADNGICDVDGAKQYVQKFDGNYKTILQHLGRDRRPTPAQRAFMDKWLHEWNMPLELITRACDTASVSVAKNHFKYADTILERWHKNGISTVEAAATSEENFAKDAKKPTPRSAQKNNRFINFNQREIDFDKYEKLERAYLEQKLGETVAK